MSKITIAELQEQIAKLEAENAALKQDANAVLAEENKTLQETIAELTSAKETLEAEVAAHKAANGELIQQLEGAKIASTEGIPTLSHGGKVYKCKTKRWLDRKAKKYITITDLMENSELVEQNIESGMLVEYSGGKG
jgi:regulator of replication initiation timing